MSTSKAGEVTGKLNNDFRTALLDIMEHGLSVFPRGNETKELLNYNISLFDARDRIITFAARKTNLKYLLGELIWYFSGSNDPAGILPFSKFWDRIRNDGSVDGYALGAVNSNYGHRLFGADESMHVTYSQELGILSQWDTVIEILKNDKDSRQALINIHRPNDRHATNKDVCCTTALQFFIRGDELHMITTMRSNDIWLGFTNDVFQFTMLQECLLLELRETYPNLSLGVYYHNAGSMHLYSQHFAAAENVITDRNDIDSPMIPMDVFNKATIQNLIAAQETWCKGGMDPKFDFDSLNEFKELSSYWQTLVKYCFTDDMTAMHTLFGLEDPA